jgi:hypothetical protein
MKILKLLEGILAELKRLNENLEHSPSLGENAVIVAEFTAKAARLRNNPLLGMTDIEKRRLKTWIEIRLEGRRLTPKNLASNDARRKRIENFLHSDSPCASTEIRDALAKGLGYQDFVSLYEDYKAQEGGAA